MGRHYDEERDIVLEADGGKCQACGFDEAIKVHHIVPRSSGGRDLAGNLITLCRACEKAVHAAHLWPGFLNRGRRPVDPTVVFNIMLLREMAFRGCGSSKSETLRRNYLRRRATPHPEMLQPYDLSERSLNLGYVLDGGRIDLERLPWVFDYEEFEVCVRRKGDTHEKD